MTGALVPELEGASSHNEGITHVSWNPISFPNTPPRGTVLQRDRLSGRTCRVVSDEFIPEIEEPHASATNVGTLKATTSDEDKYCM